MFYVKQFDMEGMASFGMDHLVVNVKQCDMGDFFISPVFLTK